MKDFLKNLSFYRDTKFLKSDNVIKSFGSGEILISSDKKSKLKKCIFLLNNDKELNSEKNIKFNETGENKFNSVVDKDFNLIFDKVFIGNEKKFKEIRPFEKNKKNVVKNRPIKLEKSDVFIVSFKLDSIENGEMFTNVMFRDVKNVEEYCKIFNPSFIITIDYFKMCLLKSNSIANGFGIYSIISNVVVCIKNPQYYECIYKHNNAIVRVDFDDTFYVISAIFNLPVVFDEFYDDNFIPKSLQDALYVYRHILDFNDRIKKANEMVYMLVNNFNDPLVFIVSLICIMLVVAENETSQTKFFYSDQILYFLTCNRISHISQVFKYRLSNWKYYSKNKSGKNIKENSKIISASRIFNSLNFS